jgi:hypothetical protein
MALKWRNSDVIENGPCCFCWLAYNGDKATSVAPDGREISGGSQVWFVDVRFSKSDYRIFGSHGHLRASE